MSIQDGGPAFPSKVESLVTQRAFNGDVIGQVAVETPAPGMTLRDYFAAKFMEQAYQLEESRPIGGAQGPMYRGAAIRAYLMADAMLAIRDELS